MSADAITRAEALFALATAPFVLVVLVAIAFAVGYVLGHERRNPYLDIVERARGERGEMDGAAIFLFGAILMFFLVFLPLLAGGGK